MKPLFSLANIIIARRICRKYGQGIGKAWWSMLFCANLWCMHHQTGNTQAHTC